MIKFADTSIVEVPLATWVAGSCDSRARAHETETEAADEAGSCVNSSSSACALCPKPPHPVSPCMKGDFAQRKFLHEEKSSSQHEGARSLSTSYCAPCPSQPVCLCPRIKTPFVVVARFLTLLQQLIVLIRYCIHASLLLDRYRRSEQQDACKRADT